MIGRRCLQSQLPSLVLSSTTSTLAVCGAAGVLGGVGTVTGLLLGIAAWRRLSGVRPGRLGGEVRAPCVSLRFCSRVLEQFTDGVRVPSRLPPFLGSVATWGVVFSSGASCGVKDDGSVVTSALRVLCVTLALRFRCSEEHSTTYCGANCGCTCSR